jgi:hypothetical protein
MAWLAPLAPDEEGRRAAALVLMLALSVFRHPASTAPARRLPEPMQPR